MNSLNSIKFTMLALFSIGREFDYELFKQVMCGGDNVKYECLQRSLDVAKDLNRVFNDDRNLAETIKESDDKEISAPLKIFLDRAKSNLYNIDTYFLDLLFLNNIITDNISNLIELYLNELN